MSTWDDFLLSVDMPPAVDVLERLARWLIKAGLLTPESCSGLDESDLKWSELADLGERTFCRRAVRAAIEAEGIKAEIARAQKMVKVQSVVAQGGPTLLSSEMMEVMGTEASAVSIALALQHGGKSVDVATKLKNVGVGNLGFHLQVDVPVWQLMASETEQAKIDGRVGFSYIDFTSKAMLPVWMPADTIGGRVSGTSNWQGAECAAGTIQALERALKSATHTPKFFRSLAQWTAVYSRYMVTAVASEQLTWAIASAHMDVIMRISEEARASGNSQYLAILYDDLLRRDWANRAMKKDPALNISAESMVINREIFEIAKTRLSQVLEGAGVGAGQGNLSGPGNNLAYVASTESMLAKQQAAAEAVAKRAEAATRQLAKQQEQLEQRRVSLESNGRPFQNDNKRKHGHQGNGNGASGSQGGGNGNNKGGGRDRGFHRRGNGNKKGGYGKGGKGSKY